MRNKLTETKFKAAGGVPGYLISGIVSLGAVFLICSSALAQNLFVSGGEPGNGKIFEFTPDGVETTFASGLNSPQNLAFDSEGNLFVVDSGAIYKFTPDGVRTTFALGLPGPLGLAFDSAGNLFVVDEGDIDGLGAAIYKFTSGGVRSTFASPFLCIGAGLAIDEADNLFVPDWCTGDIHMFTPTGGRSTFVSGSTHDTGPFLAFQPTQALPPPPPPIVATPSVSPDGGKFRRRVIVTLTDVTPGTTIYYTLDGSDPTTTSIAYQGTFVLKRSATVKAIAVDSSLNESGIATATFRIKTH